MLSKEESTTADVSSALTQWIIRDSSVGPIVLHKRIPPSLIGPADILEKTYFATYIADARLFEGFAFGTPPVKVGIDDGPFYQSEKDHEVETPAMELLSREAARRVKNLKVSLLVVESPKIRTEQGIGVGSTLDDMRHAYGDLRMNPVPPTFSGDCCAAYTRRVRNVFFYFSDCAAAKRGAGVVRVMIFDQ
ncbi:MAG: hypothetical protein JW807_14840 [Spirochaetes bacterium]|nr:hypothetical protein [Spirochaetota bacterium]